MRPQTQSHPICRRARHLNPAQAGLVNEDNPRLGSFRWSSFPRFCEKGKLPPWLWADDVYSWHRLEWRSARDRRTYANYLEERANGCWKFASSSPARQEVKMLKELRRRWVLGGEEFRDRMSDLASGIVRGRKRESYSGEKVRRYDETVAHELLAHGYRYSGAFPNKRERLLQPLPSW